MRNAQTTWQTAGHPHHRRLVGGSAADQSDMSGSCAQASCSEVSSHEPVDVGGLDVHAESISAAILEGEREHAEIVTLPRDLMKVRRLFRRLAKKGPVRSCYEASGAAFVLQRVLANDGFHCEVVSILLSEAIFLVCAQSPATSR